MIVISLSDCPPRLRGYLTKFLCEISTGVYVGKASARVRDGLWQRVQENCTHGRAVMVFSADTEQGYDFRIWGSTWIPVDLDGFKVMLHPLPTEKQAVTEASGKQRTARDEYVVLDLETTGLDVRHDRIIEIGAILIAGGESSGEYHTLVRPDIPLPEKITELTGITQEAVDAGADFPDAVRGLDSFVAGRLVIGYNLKEFDERILLYECRRHGLRSPLRRTQDVLLLVRRRFPALRSHRQREIARLLGVEAADTHRALADCYTCFKIYQRLTKPPAPQEEKVYGVFE